MMSFKSSKYAKITSSRGRNSNNKSMWIIHAQWKTIQKKLMIEMILMCGLRVSVFGSEATQIFIDDKNECLRRDKKRIHDIF